MYGLNGNMNWLQWLHFTGDPASLTEADQRKYHIYPTANADQCPESCIPPLRTPSPSIRSSPQ